jgi:hypothetical protein
MIVNNSITHRITIPTNANRGIFRPKKRIDHNALSASWAANSAIAVFDLLLLMPLFQTIYKEIPIKIYKLIHTGPNNQLGGLKDGLFNVTYHVETEATVNNEPMTPAIWQMMTEAASLR